MARMIFFCSKCNSTYGAESGTHNICPDCKIPLIETSITTDYWRTLSNSQKEQVRPQLLQVGNGKHMIFCRHCGKEIMDEAVICPGCGCSVQTANSTQIVEVDKSVSAGWVILSLLFPLVGGIYFFAAIKLVPRALRSVLSLQSFLGLLVSLVLWVDLFMDF